MADEQTLPQTANDNLTPKNVNDGATVGTPTIAPLARSVVANTFIDVANHNLAHSCDFISELQHNTKLKQWINSNANTIREGIRAVLKALGFSDATGHFSWLKDALQTLTRALKYIQKNVIKPILDFEKYVVQYIAKLTAIIAWIASLPSRLAALLADCTLRLTKLVGSIFTDFVGQSLSLGQSDTLNAAKEAAQTLVQTVGQAATAAQGALAIASAAQQLPNLVAPLKKGI
jgi:ubiquinone biosynthesis protein UbiJ